MKRSRARIHTIATLTVILALCFLVAGASSAYAVTLAEGMDWPGFAPDTGGDAVWFGSDAITDSHDGVDVAQSGDIGDNQTSSMEMYLNGPGTLTYWSRTSSEQSFDYLRVYLDGGLQSAVSGDTAWTERSVTIPAGTHLVRWSYDKDISLSHYNDAVYVDQVTYVNDPPVGRVDGAYLAQNEVKVLPSIPAAGDLFGSAVAIGSNVLAVGAPFDDTGFADAGSVTIFRRGVGTWWPSELITAADEAVNRHFGTTVALGNGRLAVGAGDRIYVYLDNGSTLTAYGSPITCPDGGGYGFGQVLDIDGNMLVASARSYNGQRGRVYFFQYSSGSWDLLQSLDAPDAALNDFFGTSVALDDNTLVVGAPDHDHPGAPGGSVYVFDIDSGTFSFTEELTDPRAIAADKLGSSVDVSGNTIVAGSNDPNTTEETPRVVVWVSGHLTDVLTRDVAQTNCWYGLRVALDGDTILVPDEWYDGSSKGGTVFAYQRSNAKFFDQVEKIQLTTAQSYCGYGRSAAISGSRIAVGAGVWDGPAGSTQGSAYVYEGAYYRTKIGTQLTVPVEKGLLANDTDPNTDWVYPSGYASPAYGTMTLHTSGEFEYTPASPSPAEVPFTYNITDYFSPVVGPIDAYITIAPLPTGSPVVNNGSHVSTSRDIPVDLSSLGNVHLFRTRVDSQSWSEWQWLADPKQTTVQLPAAAGSYSIQVEAAGSGGNALSAWSVTYPAAGTQFPGSDRYQTAILASQATYATGSLDEVIIATGANYPDALSAAGLGGMAEAPVLLVNPAKTRSDVLAEIKRLTQGKAAFKLYIMGGASAVPVATENWLKSSLTGETVVRFAGTDRYHTARLVATYMKQTMGASMSTKALLIPGLDFPDGLIVGPAAFSQGAPILLVGPTADQPLIDTLKAIGTTDLAVCGSAARIPVGTESTLKGSVPGLATHRATSAADAYVRSAEAAEFFCTPGNGFGLSWSGVGLATGERYPDGLAAGCIEGWRCNPLLLTQTAALPASVNAKLVGHKASIESVRFYGGDAAVSPAVRTTVTNALK